MIGKGFSGQSKMKSFVVAVTSNSQIAEINPQSLLQTEVRKSQGDDNALQCPKATEQDSRRRE